MCICMWASVPGRRDLCRPGRLSVCVLTLVCSCRALSALTLVVSHFEPLLSDSYRLAVCVVAEASKQRLGPPIVASQYPYSIL